MKKIYILSALVFIIMTMMIPKGLEAQISVWDGTATAWTHGSGTQNDPYLIESAQNLAWICNQVGSGYNYANKYFKLTTDINLASIPWTPIGDDAVYHIFRGKFDGDNHFIDNMVISSSFNSKGLFGVTGDGFSCKNLGVNIVINSTGGNSGGIVGSARGTFSITGCHIQGSLNGRCAGGIIGSVPSSSSSLIYNCHNEAAINSSGTSSSSETTAYSYAGGIIGAMTCSSILLNKCYNKGSIYASSTSQVSATVAYSGGIVGRIYYEYDGSYWYNQNRIINCYNTGSVSSYASSYNPFHTPYPEACSYSGGIVGWIRPYPYNNADYNTISNCYNTGSLSATYSSNNSSSEAMKGGIIAKIHNNYSGYVHTLNCHYLSTCGGTGVGTSQSQAQMKSSSFPTTLNTDSIVFVKDITPNINQGYPVFGSVRTLNANNISMTTATLNGDYQMPYEVDAHGFEYKKTSENNFTTVITSDSSPLSKLLTDLEIGTQYTYRFFVQKNGVYYRGTDKTFNTIQCTLSAQITSSSNTLCEGDTIIYTATATSSNPTIYQYVWSTGDSLNSISVSDDAMYIVTVTDVYGCSAVQTKQMTLYPAAEVSITGNTELCNGNSTTLTADGGIAYAWSTGSTNNSINVSQSGVYWVMATNAEGCSATTNVTVTVNPLPNVSISGNNSFCQGDNTTLTASGANTYAWNNSQSGNAITVNNAGTYTVTGTDANGCTNTATKFVSVNPTYNIPLTHSMCEDESYNFHGQNITAAGTYTHTLQTVNGCDSVLTLIVTLEALPTIAITGNTTICEGQTTSLTATGGTTYEWSNGSTTSSINVAQSGVYTVTATNAEGCSASANITVSVNPLPNITIGGNTTICEGSSTTLTASGADTYNWSTGDNTASVNISSFGVYTVTGTSSAGCSSTANVTVLVSQLPVITITGETDICTGETTTLTANGGTTYLWSNGTTDATLTVSTPGTWQVIGYNEAGCNAMASATVNVWQPATSEFSISCPDSCYTWNDVDYCQTGDYTQTLQTVHGCDSVITLHLTITVGIDDYDGFDFKVYPNPTSNIVNVECIMKNEEWSNVELYLCDAYGRLLDVVRANNHSPLQTAQIDLSQYANGVYFVKAVADGKTVAVRKVVKQ